MKDKIVVLTGAGISAESGIKTFRGADGLWEGHDIMDVASPQGWDKDQKLVLDFYNARRAQLFEVEPNLAHISLNKLQAKFDLHIITQNVDDLHERSGSDQIMHLHGELRKIRSTKNANFIIDHVEDLNLGDLCPEGSQLRPHIVWFGEAVPMIDQAVECISNASIVIIIGTSMQVYPAASLIAFAPKHAQIYYVDPYPQINHELANLDVKIIEDTAVNAIPSLVSELLNK